MTATGAAPVFSVIVPLEFHRGQYERCLRAWVEGQTYPPDRFEVVAVAPRHMRARTLARIRGLLRRDDRLVVDDGRHDMDLCVRGAGEARGANLFFTESHCWPEPDVLQRAEVVLGEHPEGVQLPFGALHAQPALARRG